jgi:hypothetical protein
MYINYSIQWKIAVNNRAIMPKDTEQDLVLEPDAHWEHFLEPKLKNALLRKKRPLTSEDTLACENDFPFTGTSNLLMTRVFSSANQIWLRIVSPVTRTSQWNIYYELQNRLFTISRFVLS